MPAWFSGGLSRDLRKDAKKTEEEKTGKKKKKEKKKKKKKKKKKRKEEKEEEEEVSWVLAKFVAELSMNFPLHSIKRFRIKM